MAKPELKTGEIYEMINSLTDGDVSELEFARVKREIEKIKRHDEVAAADLMATLYTYRGDYFQAIEQHKKAIAKAPQLPALHNNYGVTLRKANRSIEAQRHFLLSLSMKNDELEAAGKVLMISLELYDMKTFYLLASKYKDALGKIIMPEDIQSRLNQLEALMQKTSTTKEALTLFSERIMEFFKRYQVEPVNSHVTEDPEGGLFFSYELAMPQDEKLALDEHYIDFLMEKNASVMDVGAIFRRV